MIALGSFGATAIALRALRPVPPGVVAARLVNPSGDPVACAATLWEVLDDGGRRMSGDASQGCDEDGQLRWTGRAPGRWRILAVGDGCTMLDQEIELTAQEGVDLGKIALQWGGTVVGVVTENGEPAAGVEVRASNGRVTVTRPDGRYKLDGVPIGALEVRAARAFSGGGGEAVVTRGAVSTLDIALAPVAPRGVVGISVEHEDGEVVIRKVAAGLPADGVVTPGDVLVAIDGEPLNGDLTRTRRLIAGDPETEVRLELRRDGQPLSVALTRVSVQQQ